MNRKQNLTKKAQEQLIKDLQMENQFLKQKLQTVRASLLSIIDLPCPPDPPTSKVFKDLDDKKIQDGISEDMKKEEVIECSSCGVEHKKSYMKHYPETGKWECGKCGTV